MESVLTDVLEMTLPSGVNVRCYEMTVTDANRLANPKRRDQALFDILRNRIKIIESDNRETPFDPMNATIADVFSAMFGIRRVTHGDDFAYPCKCISCQKQWTNHLDLSDKKFIPKLIKWSEPGSIEGVDKNNLQFVLNLGFDHQGISKLRCQLLRGAHQSVIAAIEEDHQDTKVSELMKMRIIGIEGMVHPGDKDKTPDKQRIMPVSDDWIINLPIKKQNLFNKKYDEFDGGIESNHDLECPACSYKEKNASIPFGSRDFFSPR